ncbi:60S acidic ribosomal protein P3-1 [Platanthera zijinensis]|uniref:60S acidic ribosomal protein P3-1 n=1 Tax=Platanthera zijinensis TaxID=2320716 RepID=A0AAP0G632_9ASPA
MDAITKKKICPSTPLTINGQDLYSHEVRVYLLVRGSDHFLSHSSSPRMGVHTFVCRNSGGVWKAKQLTGDLEGEASSTFDLQRSLVPAAAAVDSSGGVQSSFSFVTPSSAVFQVQYHAHLGRSFLDVLLIPS